MSSIAAFWGAVSGTVGAGLAIRHQVRLSRPKLRLAWKSTVLDTAAARVLQVRNVGLRPATIVGPIWEISDQRYEPSDGPQLWSPGKYTHRLDQGEGIEIFIANEDLREFLVSDPLEPVAFRVGVRIDGKRIQTIAATLLPPGP